jgi:uncharacterized membrane protein required for colicin V production
MGGPFSIIIDVAIVLIVVFGALKGLKRGFVLSVAKPVKIVLGLVIAFSLCTVIADSVFEPMLSSSMTESITDFLREECSGVSAGNVDAEIPGFVAFLAVIVGFDISSVSGSTSEEILSNIINGMASPIVHLIAVIISFVVVYIVARILLWGAFRLLNAIFKNGLLGVANKILGAAWGAIFSSLIVWLILILLDYTLSLPLFEGNSNILSGGIVYNFFTRLNPLSSLIGK